MRAGIGAKHAVDDAARRLNGRKPLLARRAGGRAPAPNAAEGAPAPDEVLKICSAKYEPRAAMPRVVVFGVDVEPCGGASALAAVATPRQL